MMRFALSSLARRMTSTVGQMHRVYAGFNQPVGKEAVLFVDLLGHFQTRIG